MRDFAFRRVILVAGVLFFPSLGTTTAQQPAPATDPQWLTVRGCDILAPDGRPIRLRGFNLLWWAPPTAQDAADVQELGANCVRYMFGYQPKGRFEFCGEWGVITRAPGYEKRLEDVAAVLEENALPWAHWAWVVKPHQPAQL
ncbi:MAG: hypothetical protein FJ290_20260 [Planctomycetes bacterium]|nr:hypothetical protein [Planctomycetota bacterium]